MSTSLPTGRAGQALALAILAGLVVLIWSVVIAPLSQWYGERADLLGEQQILARRMTDIAASLGDARRLAATGSAGRAATTAVLEGGTGDGIGAAEHRDLACRAGRRLSPHRPAGIAERALAGADRPVARHR
jgi:hypothetical protein